VWSFCAPTRRTWSCCMAEKSADNLSFVWLACGLWNRPSERTGLIGVCCSRSCTYGLWRRTEVAFAGCKLTGSVVGESLLWFSRPEVGRCWLDLRGLKRRTPCREKTVLRRLGILLKLLCVRFLASFRENEMAVRNYRACFMRNRYNFFEFHVPFSDTISEMKCAVSK